MTIKTLIGIILTLLSLSCFANTVTTNNSVVAGQWLRKAQKEFADGRYDKSRAYYRRHLKTTPRDADAWTQLAVSIYFCGEPELAIQYLRKWEAKTSAKSYSLYYQGLVHIDLNQTMEAKAALTKAARFNDEYAARSTYELVVLEHNEADLTRSMYWINVYRQRYPQGAYLAQIARLEQSLRVGPFLGPQTGNRRPSREQSLFKFHPYAMTTTPHFWFIQVGYVFNSGDTVQPDSNSSTGTKTEAYSKHDLLSRAGIGVGPLIQNDFSSVFGYTYQQDWHSTDERLEEYMQLESPTDLITYFPFRPDLLERTHRVYTQITYKFPKIFDVGLDLFQEYSFIGSKMIPSSEDSSDDQYSAQTRDAVLLRPYVRATINHMWNLTAYFYFYKELQLDAPESSFKTYDLREGPALSLGITQEIKILPWKLDIDIDIFQFEYIYNDYWMDFTRLGGLVGGEIDVEADLRAGVGFGYYEDQYQLGMLRVGPCEFRKRDPAQDEAATSSCPRKDTGMIFQGYVTYDYSPFTKFMLRYTMIENVNPTLIIYEQTENIIEFNMSMAFPNNERIAPFVERFGDIIHTKRAN